MQVENFECQIARGQMARYLSGESLAPDVASELKTHIAGCTECAEALESKRAVLQAMLGDKAVVAISVPDSEGDAQASQGASVRGPLMNLLLNRAGKAKLDSSGGSSTPAEGPRPQAVRVLVYSVALGAVVIGMSYLMQDPTRLFGEKAVSLTVSTTPPESTPPLAASSGSVGASSSTDASAATAAAARKDDLLPDRTDLTTPQTSATAKRGLAAPPKGTNPPAPTPAVSVARTQLTPKPGRSAKTPVRARAPRSAQPRGTIRVYGPDGRPLGNP